MYCEVAKESKNRTVLFRFLLLTRTVSIFYFFLFSTLVAVCLAHKKRSIIRHHMLK